jgi:sortase A
MPKADRLLLLLELGLLLGLGLVLYSASGTLRTLNENSAVAKYVPPTVVAPTPTALIRVASLPTSAYSSIGSNWSAPSPTDWLPNLPILVTPLPPLPIVVLTATPADAHANRIVIQAIGVDAPVVHGVGPEALKLGVGHYEGAANPGEAGNLVLAGHDDVYGEVFRNLPKLKGGDDVTVYSARGEFRYIVRGSRIVPPTDVGVLAPTAWATFTLISCYPYRVDNQRIVVFGDLIAE